MKTIKQFVEESHIDERLIRAVIRQMGGWESFKESARDVARHGIDGGFHGFIYYSDTVPFAKRNKGAIIELCKEMADEFGESGVISFITSFNCLKGESQEDVADGLYNPRSDNQTMVFNALAWFVGEEVCRSFDNLEGELERVA